MSALALVVAASMAAAVAEPAAHGSVASAAADDGVDIHIVGSDADRAWLRARLAGFVGPLAVELRYHEHTAIGPLEVLEPTATVTPARARVWIDLQQPDRAMLYVIDAAYERVLVRRLGLADGLDEVASEEIGTIVESSLRALLEGGAIGVARAQLVARMVPSPVPSPVAPPPPPRARAVITLGAGYAATAWAADVAEHGPSLVFELAAARGRVDAGARIDGRVVLPTERAGAALNLSLRGGGARAYATLAWRVVPRVAIAAAVGAGFERVIARAHAGAAGAEPFRAQRDALAVIAVAAGPALELGRAADRVLVRLELAVDVVPQQLRYLTADTRAVLFEPWIVRPGATVTIAWRRRG